MKIRILAIRKKVREVRNQIGMIVKKDNDLFSNKVLARTSIAEHTQYIQHLLVNIPVVFEPLVHQLDRTLKFSSSSSCTTHDDDSSYRVTLFAFFFSFCLMDHDHVTFSLGLGCCFSSLIYYESLLNFHDRARLYQIGLK